MDEVIGRYDECLKLPVLKALVTCIKLIYITMYLTLVLLKLNVTFIFV